MRQLSDTGSPSELEWMLHTSEVDEAQLAEALVRGFYGLLYQYALLYTGQPSAAAAAARSTLRLAVRQRHRYTGEVPLQTWLLSAAAGESRRMLWQYFLGRMVGGGLKEVESFAGDLLPAAPLSRPTSEGLVEYLEKLEGIQRSLVFLVFSTGLTVLEAAIILRKDPLTLQQQLAQVRQGAFPAAFGVPNGSLPGHESYIEQAAAAAAGLLDLEAQAALDVHLAGCADCRSRAAQLEALENQLVLAASAAYPVLSFSPQRGLSDLAAEIAGKPGGGRFARWTSLSFKEISLGFAALLLILLLAWYGSMYQVENSSPIQPTPSPTSSARSVYLMRVTATPEEPIRVTLARPTPVRIDPGHLRFGEQLIAAEEISGSQIWDLSGSIALSTALRYWGWQGDHTQVISSLQPNSRDKTVLPYELAAYAETEGNLSTLYRPGGSIVLLRKLVLAGFPVIIQKGVDVPGERSWYGHYQIVYDYNEKEKAFLLQNNFLEEGEQSLHSDFLLRQWRTFNYSYLVVYPAEVEETLFDLLGPHASDEYAAAEAARTASEEIFTSRGRTLFFAWFNRATSLALLDDYNGAAQAYDEARMLLSKLPQAERPWRLFVYQTRPFWAYYYTGRYQEVVTLADEVLEWAENEGVEEAFYWRAMAREAMGDRAGAIADLSAAVRLNPNFSLGLENLKRLQGGA